MKSNRVNELINMQVWAYSGNGTCNVCSKQRFKPRSHCTRYRYQKNPSPIKYTDTATYRSSVTANMYLIDMLFFWYRYRVVIMCSVTGALVVQNFQS